MTRLLRATASNINRQAVLGSQSETGKILHLETRFKT